MSERDEEFRKELACLINRHSRENGSDTPDFILADYLDGCLRVFDGVLQRRETWYGRKSPFPTKVGALIPPAAAPAAETVRCMCPPGAVAGSCPLRNDVQSICECRCHAAPPSEPAAPSLFDALDAMCNAFCDVDAPHVAACTMIHAAIAAAEERGRRRGVEEAATLCDRRANGHVEVSVAGLEARKCANAVRDLAPRDSAPVCWKCGAPYRDAGACGYCQAPRDSGKEG